MGVASLGCEPQQKLEGALEGIFPSVPREDKACCHRERAEHIGFA